MAKHALVGGFNPSEKYESKWASSPNRNEIKTCLKPPPSEGRSFFPCFLAQQWGPTTSSRGMFVRFVKQEWRCLTLWLALVVGSLLSDGTVDGSEILHQLRLVVYPIIYRVSYIPGGAGFLPSTVFQCSSSLIIWNHIWTSSSRPIMACSFLAPAIRIMSTLGCYY